MHTLRIGTRAARTLLHTHTRRHASSHPQIRVISHVYVRTHPHIAPTQATGTTPVTQKCTPQRHIHMRTLTHVRRTNSCTRTHARIRSQLTHITPLTTHTGGCCDLSNTAADQSPRLLRELFQPQWRGKEHTHQERGWNPGQIGWFGEGREG